MGVPGVTLPARPDPGPARPTQAALAAFEALPPVRVLFDNGAGGAPGTPYPGFERRFNRFPIPGTRARSWYFGAERHAGRQAAQEGPQGRQRHVHLEQGARPATDFTAPTPAAAASGRPQPNYDWRQPPAGTAASYVSAPAGTRHHDHRRRRRLRLDSRLGPGRRPPGHGHRGAAGRQGDLRPERLAAEQRAQARREAEHAARAGPEACAAADTAKLPKGKLTKVTIPLYYEGHALPSRARGSASRSARPTATSRSGRSRRPCRPHNAKVTVAFSHKHQSRLVLPLVPGISAPTPLPPCPGLRGEPCRNYP